MTDERKPGKLYVVATPIGNLGDFSPRAIETLETVDFIAAEDTRVGAKLLNKFEIKKPQISYFEHNRKTKGEYIVERILAGESCAIITDAGTPAISDPGVDLVELCAKAGIEVVAVPGCSAVVAALSISGMACGRFTFEGFLSTTTKNRKEHLNEVKFEKRTMVFYEAPHKLLRTLQDMLDCWGDRPIALCPWRCQDAPPECEPYCPCWSLWRSFPPGWDRRRRSRTPLSRAGHPDRPWPPPERAAGPPAASCRWGRECR